jgi:UDP-N-acetylmuramoyl-L-alanyl-D-glutamate--2,6-diaminopimelate ligase
MEVSSHALQQHRVTGLAFDGGVFTNITSEHMEYHASFEEYLQAKKRLFELLPSSSFALVNADDEHSAKMVEDTKADAYTYGLHRVADFKGKVLENSLSGLKLDVEGQEVHTRLVGGFNAYNLLAAYGVGCLLEEEEQQVLTELSKAEAAEGRFDYMVGENRVIGIVDYAHSSDALKQVLHTINEVRSRQETLITVVGCVGDRDREKRPVMGQVASKLSDKFIFTSDNLCSEDPNAIIEDMLAGVDPVQQKKVLKIPDRAEAIKTACSMANPSDIVLVAGKGHEKYQEIDGEKRPFDDKAVLKELLNPVEERNKINSSH